MSDILIFYRQMVLLINNTIILLVLLLLPSLLNASNFVEESFFSKSLKKQWRYSIYLPPNYHQQPYRKYPTIYLLHGMYNSNRTIGRKKIAAIFNNAIHSKILDEAIIIVPNGNGDSWWINSKRYGPINDAFIYDLIPYIDKKYQTINSRRNRVIMGTSMGGFGALNLALKYPSYFKTTILLSPALYQPNPKKERINHRSHPRSFQYLMVRQNMIDRGAFGRVFNEEELIKESYPTLYPHYLLQQEPINILLYYGTEDSVTDNPTQNFIDYLKNNEVKATIVALKGKHTWKVWQEALDHIFINNPTFLS